MTSFLAVVVFGVLLAALPARGQAALPGTAPLSYDKDPAVEMVNAINGYLREQTGVAFSRREQFWHRDYSSLQAYERSIAPNRQRLRKIIGAVDPRVPVTALHFESGSPDAVLARGRGYKIYAVRWPVFDDVDAEGLLLQPDSAPRARVVAVPDADWSPEMLAGLTPGLYSGSQFARRLAEQGCQVLVPVLIDRADTWSGVPGIRMTNLPHREWIYRMAYEVGRHIIGYEVQKILAAVDWFEHENAKQSLPTGVAGYGEGGLLALYASSLDTRIQATLVSGYFQPREQVANEPIYRDLWGLLLEFGDAELAGMIAPRSLLIEASRPPKVDGPPAPSAERKGAAPGAISGVPASVVRSEAERARPVFSSLRAEGSLQLFASEEEIAPGSPQAISAFLRSLGMPTRALPASEPVERVSAGKDDPSVRLHQQFDQLVTHTQTLVRRSDGNRAQFWSRATGTSPERWKDTAQPLRDYVWQEVIGRMPDPSAPAESRTRLIYDEPRYRGYQVMLNVWPGVFAEGILLVPKDIREGERRPVVVCQHGLEGRPQDVADPKTDSPYYHRFAVRLAEQGFITFAPQNPYIGEDRFRQIQRNGHPLKLSIFSFILGQHQRILEWLGALPFVDKSRIGFYGLSYGGKTAARVPPLLDGYALSICSADFNEWVWKTTSVGAKFSYMFTGEYDMYEFDFGNVVNYGELASMMAPRPYMVERGHDDGVSSDEWVAYEYAKVRRFYDKMGVGDRTEIEFFDGPHTIHGQGTFAFLKKHLRWPQ